MNGVTDETETDTDCGGPYCPPCAVDAACSVDSDCSSQLCLSNVCVHAPSALPTQVPTPRPTPVPVPKPTPVPVPAPTPRPSTVPIPAPSALPTPVPTPRPTVVPTPTSEECSNGQFDATHETDVDCGGDCPPC